MTRVWPADTATAGISILAADLGNVGALAGPESFEGTESVQSMEMGNWTGEREIWKFGLKRHVQFPVLVTFIQTLEVQRLLK